MASYNFEHSTQATWSTFMYMKFPICFCVVTKCIQSYSTLLSPVFARVIFEANVSLFESDFSRKISRFPSFMVNGSRPVWSNLVFTHSLKM